MSIDKILVLLVLVLYFCSGNFMKFNVFGMRLMQECVFEKCGE